MSTPKLTVRKSAEIEGRYNVTVDGVKAGWASKSHDGTWSFNAHVESMSVGKQLDSGAATRREAIENGLDEIRTRYLSCVYVTNWNTYEDERVQLPLEALRDAQYEALKTELLARLSSE